MLKINCPNCNTTQSVENSSLPKGDSATSFVDCKNCGAVLELGLTVEVFNDNQDDELDN